MIAIDLSNQQALDADPKAIRRITFIGNLQQVGQTSMYFNIKESKEIVLDFFQGTLKEL